MSREKEPAFDNNGSIPVTSHRRARPWLTTRASPTLDDLDGPGHQAQFYDAVADILQTAGEFLVEGLRVGEPILVIATGVSREALSQWIAAEGFDSVMLEQTGMITMVDAEEVRALLASRGLDEALFQRHFGALVEERVHRSPHGRVRVYGEVADLLWQAGETDAAVWLEEMWNQIPPHTFSLLCGYAARCFDNEADMRRVCAPHTHVLPADRRDRAGGGAPRAVDLRPDQMCAFVAEIALRKEIEGELRATVRQLRTAQEDARRVHAERAELLQRERLARQEAEAANRAKDEFLAMLGHELRNPLAPIMMAVDLLDRKLDGAVAKERAILHRQAHHLSRLVDDLLDVSRIARGLIDVEKKRINLAPVVSKSIEMATPLLEERRHRLVTSMPEASLTVFGDAHRLAQVLSNLLTNAAKYSEPGGLIELIATSEGEEVVLRVRDRGVGISPELLPGIFEAFVRGSVSQAHDHRGLGLGLAIVKGIVTLHGGTVEAHRNSVDRGSEFVVRLPAARSAGDADGERPAAPSRPRREVQSRRILVVDDNADAAELVVDVLVDLGHEARMALDGYQALAVAEGFRPEAAILDIGLPGMDGYELAGKLRTSASPAGIKLVALTGYGQPGDQDRAHAAGFDAHATKPIDVADLDRLLARLFDAGAALTSAAGTRAAPASAWRGSR
jgi:signal transduction histidine kinase/ActR/RegA family two-component response regulator